MIVTRLIGGLGNQMFQYAYGLYLAQATQQELFIDVSGFEDYTLHALAIDNFAISAKRLPESEMHRIPGRYRGTSRVQESVQCFLGKFRKSGSLTLRREKPFGFQAAYMESGSDLYLAGYWQGESFFPQMRAALRNEFALMDLMSSMSQDLSEQMANCNSVAVHVRRGDYVSNPETGKIYRRLDADYYRKCLNDLKQHVDNPQVFLFSNDIDWCLKNLDVGIPFTPVTHTDASTAHEDLYLISRCRHAVIANSTFSWWGAFLGNTGLQSESQPADSQPADSHRRVYYPEPWFNPGTLNGNALGCHDWIGEQSISDNVQRIAA